MTGRQILAIVVAVSLLAWAVIIGAASHVMGGGQ